METVRIIHSLNKGLNKEYIAITQDFDSPASDFVKHGDTLISDEQIEWSLVPYGFPMECSFIKEY